MLSQLTPAEATIIAATLAALLALATFLAGRRDARLTSAKVCTDIMAETVRVQNDQIKALREQLETDRAERDALIARMGQLEELHRGTCEERDRLQVRVTELEAEIAKLHKQLEAVCGERISRRRTNGMNAVEK